MRTMGIRDKPIAPGSPWQNGFVERLIGSIRRDCVDHVVALGEGHVRRVLRSYARGSRAHVELRCISGNDGTVCVRHGRPYSPGWSICAGTCRTVSCLPFLSSPNCEGTKLSKLQLALTFIRAWLRAD
jgi:Integrase core domain